ncbi:hypothetical protein FA13DRAFT_1711839 [Coprinellus micaceus]|uniref:F-box domain-containing protein n=1 Tax=Coprinellus micaceus TaxID=71717 RepID=A0A4Y7T352_COPMI|nr:hypothetical protein FA13DRAFT_1711839 [Coprinellus micaceus]
MAQSSLPAEICEEIVDLLENFPDALQHISVASKVFVSRARPILFRHIRVLSFKRMVQMGQLLSSNHCTIPADPSSLEIRFESPFPGRSLGYDYNTVAFALLDAFYYFRSFQSSISMSLPWVFSRNLDWTYLHRYSGIRKFVLAGTYPWLADLTQCLCHMNALESLIVDASFKSDATPSIPPNPSHRATISPRLTEIALSPQSLCLMDWICELKAGPKHLHTMRLKVDNIESHARFFRDLVHFLEKNGGELAHLFVWFEEIEVDDDPYDTLQGALHYTPTLQQVELLFPSSESFDEESRGDLVETIRSSCVGPLSIVEVLGGDSIGIDEAEFWAPPSFCRSGEGGGRERCRRWIR